MFRTSVKAEAFSLTVTFLLRSHLPQVSEVKALVKYIGQKDENGIPLIVQKVVLEMFTRQNRRSECLAFFNPLKFAEPASQ